MTVRSFDSKVVTMKRWLVVGIAWVAAAAARGDTFEGKVNEVVDGDTVRVVDARGQVHAFRLLGADAPEKGQSAFADAQRELSTHAQGKSVTIDWVRAQICPRAGGGCAQLAKVLLKGEDLALRQIRRGFAWHDKRQLREQSTTDKTLYAEAEVQAKAARRGVWKERKPVAPWLYEAPAAPRQKAKPKKTPRASKH